MYDTKVAFIDHMEGFVLIDASDESKPQAIGSYFLDGYARDVVTSGSIAYATDSPTGVYVFDLARDGLPEPIGVLHAPAAPRNALQVTNLPDGLNCWPESARVGSRCTTSPTRRHLQRPRRSRHQDRPMDWRFGVTWPT